VQFRISFGRLSSPAPVGTSIPHFISARIFNTETVAERNSLKTLAASSMDPWYESCIHVLNTCCHMGSDRSGCLDT
jgi:hypothetical protein